ncbi:MAG: hypothetical protein HC845_00455 [Akkermansiaceae bacterium]|nr:hypothetical protein [Akkermansiaceae bacterium]
MRSTLSRENERVARHILAHPDRLGIALKEKRWADVAALVTFVKQNDSTHDLAMTDPALYRTLRQQITTFYLRGGGALNLEKLRQLATANS